MRIASLLLLAPFVFATGAAPAAPVAAMRGVVISCPTWGPEWGGPEMDEALADIKALGATWAQIHPYARIAKNGAINFTNAEQLGFLARAKLKTDKAGMQLFLKPHLAYWGTFDWRGAITFKTEADWTRFFRDYTAFIVDQARFAEAHGIPLFALGTELDATIHRKEWSDVIRAVRAVYKGKVTYAANWDSLDRVPFWDKLDFIGVQAYFPVGSGTELTTAQIESGWDRHADALRALWHKTGRKVIFAEVGYPRSTHAADEPWKPQTIKSGKVIALRARLMDVVLQHAERQPWFAGMFWWKWMPGFALFDRDFSMKDDEAKAALKRFWAPASR